MLRLPILYYHKVAVPPVGRNPTIFVTPHGFRSHLQALTFLGYRTVHLDEAFAGLTAAPTLSRSARRVAITFDDGHLDNYTAAAPILKEFGMVATVFVCAGVIGGKLALRSAPTMPDAIMDASQLREMDAAGVRIESHGMTHANLAEVPLDVARREIFDSKAKLEDVLGRAVNFFCYPFGSFRPAHLRLVEEAGYKAAFSTVRGLQHHPDQRFSLKRIPVHYGLGRLGLAAKLHLLPYRRADDQLAELCAPERDR